MQSLYELLSLLPAHQMLPLPPRLARLCTFLSTHPQMTEKEAATKYLGESGREKYFNKLKNELKLALMRFVVSQPSLSTQEHKAAIENCYSMFSMYKMFLLNNRRNTAIEIARSLLPKAKRFELHNMAHVVASDLLFHYSCMEPSASLAKKYEKIAELEQELDAVESKIRIYHSRIGLLCNTKESFTPAQIEVFKEAATFARPLLRLGYHHINRLIYTILVLRWSVEYNYPKVLETCDEALTSFPQDHPRIRSLRFLFLYHKVIAFSALGLLRDAKDTAKEAGLLVPTGNFNWHMVLLRRIVVCFHAGEYQEAYDLYKAHHQSPCPYENINEYWYIIKGYLYFLIERGHIIPYDNERFALGKFINQMPIYSQDKSGHNINILLIQVLIRLERKQFGQIIDRAESLQAYRRAYARNPETKRANIFIQMILKMEQCHFHRVRTEQRTKKLLEQLKDMPLRFGQNPAIEIIPYPVLWAEILGMLETKFTTSKKKSIKRNTGDTK